MNTKASLVCLFITLFAFAFSSCRKCNKCSLQCAYCLKSTSPVRTYDTLCSKDFASYQEFKDTIDSRLNYSIISNEYISDCKASDEQVRKAICF